MTMTRWCLVSLLGAACGNPSPEGVEGIDGPSADLFAEGGEPGQYAGILTLDEYDWFSTEPYLGTIRLDLSTGGKRRFLDGRNPWMHPSGNTVFIQPCGDGVSRVAVADARGLFDVVSPCSSKIKAPGYTPPDFGFVKLSPDQTRVAAEMYFYEDFDWAYATVVFEEGVEIARFSDLWAPEWLEDGRLLLSGEGLYVADEALVDVRRIDDNQLNGPTNNPAIHPDGDRIAFEFNQRLWEIRLDGSGLEERVYGDRALRYPAWSPDGSTLAYLGVEQRDYYDRAIYFTDVNRGESTYLDLNPVLDSDTSVVPKGPLSWR